MDTPRERSYQTAIQRLIKGRGGWCVSTTRLSPIMRGIPDLLVCYRGVFIAIEVKGTRTPYHKLQRLAQERMAHAGAIVIVARGTQGVELVERVLNEVDQRESEVNNRTSEAAWTIGPGVRES